MKRINAKKIVAVAAGAALLGIGLAFSGGVTFSSVPIINNAGQPVVQIVIGSGAKPSDGVAAANIAAAIGNLAYTSENITATVNATQAAKVLSAQIVGSSGYTLSNQQVWLKESASATAPSGSYGFTALIGSVLNRGIQLNSPSSTKSLDNSGTYSYVSQSPYSLTASPLDSPYSTAGSVPTGGPGGTPQTGINGGSGGGITFTGSAPSSTNGATRYDNIMQVSNSNLPSLLSNSGPYGETEYLWLTGFPVYDGQTGYNNFALLSADGAYQVVFSNPITITSGSGHAYSNGLVTGINNAAFTLLGQNYTIINATLPTSTATSTTAVPGGKLEVAQSLTPLTSISPPEGNITSGNFKVVLTDMGQPNVSGIAPAIIDVLYNGKVTNNTAIFPGHLVQFNVSGHILDVKVNQTVEGFYAYSKYAKIQLYSNVMNFSGNGQQFNKTTNPNWDADILWSNSSGTAGIPIQLKSIILYGTSTDAQTLLPGQSFSFITSPSVYKLQFVGDTLTAANMDPLTVATSSQTGGINYENTFGSGSPTISNITEPAQELVVTSQIPNAFSYAGVQSSSVTYDLTPYELITDANAIAVTGGIHLANAIGTTVTMTGSGVTNLYTTQHPSVTVTLTGYTFTNTTPITYSATTAYVELNAGDSNVNSTTYHFYNITNIKMSEPILGTVSVVAATSDTAQAAVPLATLEDTGSTAILYTPTSSSSQYTYALASAAGNVVTYNQQNGQPTNYFALAATWSNSAPTVGTTSQFFTYTINEYPIPNVATLDSLSFGLVNSSAGVSGANPLQLNYSTGSGYTRGTKNNVTYVSSQPHTVTVQPGFRTEKGSSLVSVSPTELTFNLAKNIDGLDFIVAPETVNVVSTSKAQNYGPYGVGVATNIPNVSIGAVNATIAVSSANVVVAGIQNLTATPSQATAIEPVLLKNLGTTSPLVVLDSSANPSSNLILIGSGYVNSLSAQLNVSITPSNGGPITAAYGSNRILVAGYTANQTTAAANNFIQDLYTNAAMAST